jgi:acetyl-CoA C-acetyltransferase
MLGEGQAYIAGGVESMTRAPFVMGKAESAYSRSNELFDTTMGWRFINEKLSALHHPYTMGETAENVAKQWNISRLAQDEWAYRSQVNWKKANEEKRFAQEIVSVPVPQKKGEPLMFSTDEHPRLSTVEELTKLRPAFIKDGTVTAGNASGINDGAAACLITDEETMKNFGLKPMARVVSMAVAGVSPDIMGIGPVPAVQKALKRAGLTLQDIGLWELNEAFASQVLACMQELNLSSENVNVNGGSIAIGHPLGASGVRISATLLHEMQKRQCRYGVATMCIGVGQGAAIVYERC